MQNMKNHASGFNREPCKAQKDKSKWALDRAQWWVFSISQFLPVAYSTSGLVINPVTIKSCSKTWWLRAGWHKDSHAKCQTELNGWGLSRVNNHKFWVFKIGMS